VAVPLLVRQLLPAPVAGVVFAAITVGALVPAAVMSISAATSFVRNVYVAHIHPTATPKRQVRVARLVSLTAKVCAVAFVLGLRDQDAINLQLLGGVWILQIFPAVAIGTFTGWLRPRALLAGWATGMVAGTVIVLQGGFSPVVTFGPTTHAVGVYAGLVALFVNLTVAGSGTLARRLVRSSHGAPARHAETGAREP
jgi:SSS family solute:Na+ symporter